MNINKKKRVVSIMLCVAMLMPMASMAMPVGAQGEDAFAGSSVDTQKDIGEPGVDYVDGEVIVKFKSAVSGVTEGQAVDFFNDVDCIVKSAWKSDDSELIDCVVLKSDTLSTEDLMDKLSGQQNVKYVQPNHIYEINENSYKAENPEFDDILSTDLAVDNISGQVGIKDIDASQIQDQWALYNPVDETPKGTPIDIDVKSIWDKGVTGSEDIVIAVLDDGIGYDCEDLNDKEASRCNIYQDNDGCYGYNTMSRKKNKESISNMYI